jgi:hypothetical protein
MIKEIADLICGVGPIDISNNAVCTTQHLCRTVNILSQLDEFLMQKTFSA